MNANKIADRIGDLVPWLLENQALWYERPLIEKSLSWHASHPEMVAWLHSLDEQNVELLESDPWALSDVPRDFERLRHQARDLTRVPRIEGPALTLPAYAKWKIPHRKLEQSLALSSLAAPWLKDPEAHALEWCAGKAHLARVCSKSCGCRTSAIERDADVVKAGVALHRRAQADIRYEVADVLKTTSFDVFRERPNAALSLHACGVLTDTLTEHALRLNVPVQVSAFCCFHFTGGKGQAHVLRSQRVASLPLRLDQVGLRLALTDESCAAERHKRHRRQDMIWRLGARQELLSRGALLPWSNLGNLPTPLKRLGYGDFVQTLCAEYGVELSASWDSNASLEQAKASVLQARRSGIIRSIFRRALECWHVFDRALWAVEAGREVVLGTFVERASTPRNLALVHASPQEAAPLQELTLRH